MDYLFNSGTATDTVVNTGYINVYSGGTDIGTTVVNQGQEYILNGGTAIDTVVNQRLQAARLWRCQRHRDQQRRL